MQRATPLEWSSHLGTRLGQRQAVRHPTLRLITWLSVPSRAQAPFGRRTKKGSNIVLFA